MSKRVRSDSKIKSKSKSVTSGPAPRFRLFGQPPILEGEDGGAYDELLARICAAVKPFDIIDEMFIAEVVSLEWEVLRWRRLKSSLIRARGLKALEGFLGKQLDYELTRSTLPTIWRKFFRTIFRKTRRKMHRHWRAVVPRMNRTLSTRSMKCSPASARTWTTS